MSPVHSGNVIIIVQWCDTVMDVECAADIYKGRLHKSYKLSVLHSENWKSKGTHPALL